MLLPYHVAFLVPSSARMWPDSHPALGHAWPSRWTFLSPLLPNYLVLPPQGPISQFLAV